MGKGTTVIRIRVEDAAILRASKERTGLPICAQIHDAIIASYKEAKK